MKQLLLLFFIALPLTTHAAKPSRRELIQQGEQNLEDKAQNHLQNSAVLTFEKKDIPVLGYSFSYPKDWGVSIRRYAPTASTSPFVIDGDYTAIYDEKFQEGHSMFIYTQDTQNLATIEDIEALWSAQQRQPDHDNVYEYSHLSYIRELNVLSEERTSFQGKEALKIELTFSSRSTFWKETAVMFPWGKKIYTISYRSEMGYEDRFSDAFDALLHSFTFHAPEPQFTEVGMNTPSGFSDVPQSYRYAHAVGHLRTLGILSGYADGSFHPDDTINRAEFIKIMTSDPLLSSEIVQKCSKTSFPDVSADAWYAPHVCVAKFLGMIEGYPDGTFKPEQTISFVEAAKIIATFYNHTDSQEADDAWFTPFVRGLAKRRAIPITINGLSAPLLRGEMSEIIYRLQENIEGESLQLEEIHP